MNITYALLPPAPSAPASVRISAGRRRVVAKAVAAVWRALEAAGRARAQRHMLAFADRCEAQQPEISRDLRAAARRGPLA